MNSNNKILVIGSSNTDMTIKTERLPELGETVLGGIFSMGKGGKGANQAVAAKRLGGNVSFICKVGRDMFGENSISHYRNEGLDISHVLRSEKESGIAMIVVDKNGENHITVAPGANSDFSSQDIRDNEDAIKEASILLLQLEIPVESICEAARTAGNAGVKVILNPAPACELPSEIFENIHILIPNQTELALLSGITVESEENIKKAAGILKQKGVKSLIVTLGSKGSMVFDGDDDPVMIPAIKVKAVDTTAAGDTFCGALCVALSEGMNLVEAAKFATKASSLTVQKLGAQDSIPYRKDL